MQAVDRQLLVADGARLTRCGDPAMLCSAAEPRTYRVLGLPQNAALIVALAEARQRVWAYAPTLRGEPEQVLAQLQQPPPTHLRFLVHACDLPSFRVIAAAVHTDYVFGQAVNLLGQHPAWPALSFIGGVRLDAAFRVLAMLGDPRWYRDPVRPGRINRLYTYFGLAPHVQRRVSPRRQTLEAIWWGQHQRAAPAHFLWRAYVEAGGHEPGRVAASRRLLRLLVEVWLQAVVSVGRRTFCADRFFRVPEEAAAFRAHCLACGAM